MIEQIIAAFCISSEVTTPRTQFHQSYISVLQREVITVFLSSPCLYSQGAVQRGLTRPVAKQQRLNAF